MLLFPVSAAYALIVRTLKRSFGLACYKTLHGSKNCCQRFATGILSTTSFSQLLAALPLGAMPARQQLARYECKVFCKRSIRPTHNCASRLPRQANCCFGHQPALRMVQQVRRFSSGYSTPLARRLRAFCALGRGRG